MAKIEGMRPFFRLALVVAVALVANTRQIAPTLAATQPSLDLAKP